MRSFFVTLAVLFVGSFATQAVCQTATPGTGTHGPARELAQMALSDKTFDAVVDNSVSALVRLWLANAADVKMSEDEEAKVAAKMTVVIRRAFLDIYPRSDWIDALAPIYSENLTTEDMSELIRFYNTPVGSKALLMTGKMITEGGKAGEALIASKVAEFRRRVQEDFV